MSRSRKMNANPISWGGPFWRGPEFWKYIPGPPAWYRRLRNRLLRRRQDREARRYGEVRTPRKRDVRWLWW